MSYVKDLVNARHVLRALSYREIRGQYRSTLLGQLWSLANPLTQMLVYTFVFSFIFKVKSPIGDPSGVNSYALFLLCGLIPWSLFQTASTKAMGSLLANSNLISKVYFPRLVIPLSTVVSTGYNSVFEFFIVIVALAIAGSFVWPWLPLVVVLIVLLLVFAAGIGLMLSIANMYFRDTQYLAGIAFQLWMWFTPIVYPMSLIADRSTELGPIAGTPITVLDIYRINPLVHFVTVFRDALYDNRFPQWPDLLACLIWSLVALATGWLVFRKHESKLAELL